MGPSQDTNVFSLSDQVLSDKLQFIEEIGCGNWGSVWLCRPKKSPASPPADGLDNLHDTKIAVKLVHRSKTPTTAARVRSLWNEMKIIRTFKNDPHPSIIPFHSFIITPSYALITMAFLPTLIPVEIDESRAREWFRSLLSGVEFLHKRGVVHNDIKPANILLSHSNLPVLVDFGFAEKYDLKSSKAFHSNLSYGTPEYLSPERARGLPHDTRKSDVWSLGISFFEILIGRTPFEESDSEQYTTKEDLEKYWSRTLRGKWVGSWKMSKGLEKLLRRMVAPNADLRCTTSEAMSDSYWHAPKDVKRTHKKSTSAASSFVLEDVSKLMNMTAPWLSRSNKGKENLHRPPSLGEAATKGKRGPSERLPIPRTKSQLKISAPKLPTSNRGPVPLLSPVNALPPNFFSHASKENAPPTDLPKDVAATRKRVASRGALSHARVLGRLPSVPLTTKPPPEVSDKEKDKHRKRALMGLTGLSRNVENHGKDKNGAGKDSVSRRIKEWERERERMREMSRLEEMEEEMRQEREEQKAKEQVMANGHQCQQAKENVAPQTAQSTRSVPTTSSFLLDLHNDTLPRLGKDWPLAGFKHSLKTSIDRTIQMHKTSTLEQVTTDLSVDKMDGIETRRSHGERESWEDQLLRDAKSSFPAVRHAMRNERIPVDNRLDRMTVWIKNVEKVVEDARQTFASTTMTPVPPLPVAPSQARNTGERSSRLPRKVLPANLIFLDEPEPVSSKHGARVNTSGASPDSQLLQTSSNGLTRATAIAERSVHSPQRARRATVSTRSPEPVNPKTTLAVEKGSPSKRKEKCRSHGNLLQPISSISLLELELKKEEMPLPSPRISAMLDRSLFITPPAVAPEDASVPNITLAQDKSMELDELTSSPFVVEPYPPRKPGLRAMPDSHTLRRLEGVYDRFLMATSGVKRLGRGYQSDNIGPVGNDPNPHRSYRKRNELIPPSIRHPAPLPRANQKHTTSVDELGVLTPNQGDRDERNTTVAFVRRAFKAIVTGKAPTRPTLC